MSSVLSRHDRGGLSYLRGGNGTPLFLLHGIPGSAHSWEAAGEHLTSNYDVIIPDLGGFGASDTLEHLDHDFYLEAHADAVHRFVNDLGIQNFFLGGHGFGGAVALTLLRLFPDHAVEGLVLAATNLFATSSVPLPLRLARLPVLGSALARLGGGTRLGRWLMYWAAVHNKAAFRYADFTQHFTSAGVRQTQQVLRRSLTDPQGTYREIEEALPHIDVPTLVLGGDRDPFFPVSEAKRIVRALSYATLTILDETGHFVPEERSEMTAWHVDDFFRAPLRKTGKTRPERSSTSS
jgi:pimeloyl-ACP methyl ester carboxylesterase